MDRHSGDSAHRPPAGSVTIASSIACHDAMTPGAAATETPALPQGARATVCGMGCGPARSTANGIGCGGTECGGCGARILELPALRRGPLATLDLARARDDGWRACCAPAVADRFRAQPATWRSNALSSRAVGARSRAARPWHSVRLISGRGDDPDRRLPRVRG